MTTEKQHVSILLVDDHKVVRDGLKYTLNLHHKLHFHIDEAETGDEAVLKARDKAYDIIIMDIKMPNLDGVKATREIMMNNRNSKILALSMFDEENQIRTILKAGALGYLLKDTGAEELIRAISEVVDGRKYYCNKAAQMLMGNLHDEIIDGSASPSVPMSLLSERETEITQLIAEELTNEEIATQLNISKRTVDSHRQNILQKLNVKNTAGLIKYAVFNGLVEP